MFLERINRRNNLIYVLKVFYFICGKIGKHLRHLHLSRQNKLTKLPIIFSKKMDYLIAIITLFLYFFESFLNPIAKLMFLSLGLYVLVVSSFILYQSFKHKCTIKEVHKRLERTSFPIWVKRIFTIGIFGILAAQISGYKSHKNNDLPHEGIAVYNKKNNKISIDTTTQSPQIISLSWGLNTQGKCDEGAIDCFENVALYTVKSSFGYRTEYSNAFNIECLIDIEVLNKKLKVTYQGGTCDTGIDNRFTLRQISGIYSLD